MHESWPGVTGRPLVTRGGEPVHVVYPGIPAGNFGPDYRDAVVAFGDGEPVRGDVELHLRSEDWRRHGHGSDSEYRRVILHVVGDGGGGEAACSVDGREVPEVSLVIGRGGCGAGALPCARRGLRDESTVRALLAQAGVARLRARAAREAAECAGSPSWTSLGRAVARALGYAANAEVATELGNRMTNCAMLRTLPAGDGEFRRAVALGIAGLLPAQRVRAGLAVEEDCPRWDAWWRGLERTIPAMSPLRWRLDGLYPNNSPVRRIVALADLWPSLPAVSEVAAGIIEHNCALPRRCAGLLEGLFMAPVAGYWRHHYDFGRVTRESDIIGVSKAREVVVNALLPWVAAKGLTSGAMPLLVAVARLSTDYPAAPAYAVTRHMRRQLNLAKGAVTAGEQQGMVHLFREYCCHGRCDSCPLGGRWTRTRRRVKSLPQAALEVGDVTWL